MYDHGTGEGVLGARLVMPVLVLSYNGLGSKLAAGGEDEIIYIINLSTNHETNTLKVALYPCSKHCILLLLLQEYVSLQTTVIQKLRAGPHTRGLAYDPEGEYLASLSATGHLQIWRLEDGKQKLSQRNTAPNASLPDQPQLRPACSRQQIRMTLPPPSPLPRNPQGGTLPLPSNALP